MGTNAYKVKNHINIQPGSAPSNPTLGDIYCDVSGVFRRWNGTIWEVLGAGGGSGTSVDVSQTAHGFVAADIGKAIRSSGVSGEYTFAMADAANNAEVVGIISDASSGVPDQFSYIAIGPMTGLSGLTTGEVYFLSASASGVATTTEPSVVGQISKPLYVATSPTTAIILNSRGTTVGGTNLSTTIGLTLAGTKTIQNVLGYPVGGGGKINGTITVLGPTPIQGCRVEISFQKIASDTYNISAAFPASSIIAASGALSASVTSGGDIQITLPTITGATSASITFSIDAAAVGATLPLQIDSNLISWREPTMFRNRVINGNMGIDQRAVGTQNNTVSTQYHVDRWNFVGTVGAKFSIQKSTTAPAGFTSSLLLSSLSAYAIAGTDWEGVRHYIEGHNVADFAWGTASAKTVTLSFWVRSSLTGTFGGSVLNGAFNRSHPFTYTINAANTWEQKTVTIMGDTAGTWATDNTVGVALVFSLGAGSSVQGTAGTWAAGALWGGATGTTNLVGTNGATFYITGVQLEPGTVATPFEFRPYGTELALCQRYYEVILPSGSAYSMLPVGATETATTANFVLPFVVEKRIAPTALEQAGTFQCLGTETFSSFAISATYTNTKYAGIVATISGGTAGKTMSIRAANNTASKLAMSAEL